MFRFKQFSIRQERTAMKVTTDACVLGAVADADTGPTRVLDIGTGTGLLALMLAQRNPLARVDAVELDPNAATQAAENVADSPFADRITVWPGAIQTFQPGAGRVYDRIVTNPPFYTNSLRSPDASVSRALHNDDLPTTDLLLAADRLLAPDGQWWVLLPPPEMTRLLIQAQAVGLSPFRRLDLRHRADMPVLRQVVGFRRGGADAITEETLVIYEPGVRPPDAQPYTPSFRALLRDFYLAF
jgi:tRNA1Val (adenine37-N6)-methyltransferase